MYHYHSQNVLSISVWLLCGITQLYNVDCPLWLVHVSNCNRNVKPTNSLPVINFSMVGRNKFYSVMSDDFDSDNTFSNCLCPNSKCPFNY